MKVQLEILDVARPEELERAFLEMTRRRVDAISYLISPMFWAYRATLAKLAEQHRLPSIGGTEDYVELGGLMFYGANLLDMAQGAARYVDRILHGVRPRDLPIQARTKFELRINLKTAKALGLRIPVAPAPGGSGDPVRPRESSPI